MIFKSLISRVILLNILLLTVGIGTFTLFHINREQRHLISSTRQSAELLLSTVEKSIFNSMQVGNSAEVQTILEMVGRNHNLSDVRIFHPDGRILRSARPEEIGTRVGRDDLELFRGKNLVGIFRSSGQEVLGIVKPILAEQRCAFCHRSGNQVLGVLQVNYSLADTASKLRDSSQFFMLSTIVIIILLSASGSFILLRLVKRPMQILANRMAQVEAGDLTVRTFPRSSDEMGSLMRSFNSMVNKLQRARKELEHYHYQQMERADRLASVGEMATGIAHEIKNPLAGISSAISVLADDFDPADPRREIVSQVLEQIARLNKTATDLLYFGRPGKPEFGYVDLNALVKNTLFFVAQHPEARNIHRVKELTRDMPLVWADQKQIQQVLFNIIINAIQAMSDGGTLLVQTDGIRHDGKSFGRVQVTDSGKGIPAEELEKIFVPFFTTKTQGTGLGLPICRQLLEQHGGSIRVESKVGEGTTFTIELPAAEGQLNAMKGDNGAPS
ncbi:two-component sensor histidine kinase [Desulfuromonas versatilis]|uniref:histidine kinase n=1 Tax=Desulfuromonas versatilis TaxID=2802975 RepID=A0ABM8HMY6_9BACT|nr:ATP-binding protein [Desulfuromonas versatilis]BCR03802.1 two-component sensor histidine kinase [Desulfuromonas versatilis]